MRRWHALPLAALVAFAAATVLFSAASPRNAAAVGGIVMEVDCDPTDAAVDNNCSLPSGTSPITVNIVITNGSASAATIGAFNFEVVTQQAFLIPTAGSDTNMNANPNFSDSTVGSTGTWSCTPPAPSADKDPGSTTARSFLSCYVADAGPTINAGQTVVVASVTYTTNDGSAFLTIENGNSGDNSGVTIVDCIDSVADCNGASVGIGVSAPVDTPTPTATNTATHTPAPPTATNTPCQTGCTPTSTSTSLAYETVTPTPGPETPTAPAGGGDTPVPASPGPGQPTAPGGGTGGSGGQPITLPDTGSGSSGGIDWSQAVLLSVIALALGGLAGGAYLGAVTVARKRDQ